MTLQDRHRSQYDDQVWRQRIHICGELLIHHLDHWCLSNSDFPRNEFVAEILFLFSKRCHTLRCSVKTLIESAAASALEEYHNEWPSRPPEEAHQLIENLIEIIDESVNLWVNQGIQSPPHQAVVDSIVHQIVNQQFVVFHHYQTTTRDPDR